MKVSLKCQGKSENSNISGKSQGWLESLIRTVCDDKLISEHNNEESIEVIAEKEKLTHNAVEYQIVDVCLVIRTGQRDCGSEFR